MSSTFSTDRIGYAFGSGHWHECDSGIEVYLSVLRELAQRDAAFLPRFEAACAPYAHGRQKRSYIARTKAALFPGRRNLADVHAAEVLPGWFVDTNLAHRNKIDLLRRAIALAGMTPGLDLEFNLGGGYSMTKEQADRAMRALLADFGPGGNDHESARGHEGTPGSRSPGPPSSATRAG